MTKTDGIRGAPRFSTELIMQPCALADLEVEDDGAQDWHEANCSAASDHGTYQFIDSRELARRWDVPVSWIRDQVRSRAEDPLPHVKLGKYVRFLWGSPDLEDWIARRIVKGNNRRVGRVP